MKPLKYKEISKQQCQTLFLEVVYDIFIFKQQIMFEAELQMTKK